MPWSPLLLGMGRKITSFWADPVLRFALLWSGFVLVFFSASSTKLPHYALYAAPGLTLLLVQACIRSSKRAWTVSFVILMAWLALCTALPGVLQQSAHWVRDAHYQNLLRSADVLNQPLAFVLCGLALLLSCWLLFVSRARHAALGYALAAVVRCMMLGSVVMPWWSQTLQGPVRQLALASRDLPGPVVQWGGHWPSFALYREQMAPRRAPAPGEMALVRFPSNTVPAHWPVIASARGMAIVQRPLTEPAQSR
jgi:4-amino-4-deoxy-L-arabinose transferase-like glycosyltransferase